MGYIYHLSYCVSLTGPFPFRPLLNPSISCCSSVVTRLVNVAQMLHRVHQPYHWVYLTRSNRWGDLSLSLEGGKPLHRPTRIGKEKGERNWREREREKKCNHRARAFDVLIDGRAVVSMMMMAGCTAAAAAAAGASSGLSRGSIHPLLHPYGFDSMTVIILFRPFTATDRWVRSSPSRFSASLSTASSSSVPTAAAAARSYLRCIAPTVEW